MRTAGAPRVGVDLGEPHQAPVEATVEPDVQRVEELLRQRADASGQDLHQNPLDGRVPVAERLEGGHDTDRVSTASSATTVAEAGASSDEGELPHHVPGSQHVHGRAAALGSGDAHRHVTGLDQVPVSRPGRPRGRPPRCGRSDVGGPPP